MKTVIDLSVPKSWQELTKQRVQSQVDLNSAEQKQSRPKVKINRSYKLYKNIKDDTGNQEQVVGNS